MMAMIRAVVIHTVLSLWCCVVAVLMCSGWIMSHHSASRPHHRPWSTSHGNRRHSMAAWQLANIKHTMNGSRRRRVDSCAWTRYVIGQTL